MTPTPIPEDFGRPMIEAAKAYSKAFVNQGEPTRYAKDDFQSGAEWAYRLLSDQGWISVEDRLPEYTERRTMWNDETNKPEPYGEPAFQIILAYNEELGVFKAEYAKHGHWSEISSISNKGSVKPTHWMPLPIAPIQ